MRAPAGSIGMSRWFSGGAAKEIDASPPAIRSLPARAREERMIHVRRWIISQMYAKTGGRADARAPAFCGEHVVPAYAGTQFVHQISGFRLAPE